MTDLEKRFQEVCGEAPTAGAFDFMRIKILKKMGTMKAADLAKLTKDWPWHHFFYPEYSSISDVRERFTRIAQDHANLKQDMDKQVMLFSLNGYFNWNSATQSTRTKTTCGLFVRACRAAAGILEAAKWATNTPSGTDPCIVGPKGASAMVYDVRGSRGPSRGDIFHVKTPGKNNDHVGVIISHREDANGNWYWSTVEGGAGGSGLETKANPNHFLPLKNGKHWLGYQEKVVNGKTIVMSQGRPVEKWIDLDRLAGAVQRTR